MMMDGKGNEEQNGNGNGKRGTGNAKRGASGQLYSLN